METATGDAGLDGPESRRCADPTTSDLNDERHSSPTILFDLSNELLQTICDALVPSVLSKAQFSSPSQTVEERFHEARENLINVAVSCKDLFPFAKHSLDSFRRYELCKARLSKTLVRKLFPTPDPCVRVAFIKMSIWKIGGGQQGRIHARARESFEKLIRSIINVEHLILDDLWVWSAHRDPKFRDPEFRPLTGLTKLRTLWLGGNSSNALLTYPDFTRDLMKMPKLQHVRFTDPSWLSRDASNPRHDLIGAWETFTDPILAPNVRSLEIIIYSNNADTSLQRVIRSSIHLRELALSFSCDEASLVGGRIAQSILSGPAGVLQSLTVHSSSDSWGRWSAVSKPFTHWQLDRLTALKKLHVRLDDIFTLDQSRRYIKELPSSLVYLTLELSALLDRGTDHFIRGHFISMSMISLATQFATYLAKKDGSLFVTDLNAEEFDKYDLDPCQDDEFTSDARVGRQCHFVQREPLHELYLIEILYPPEEETEDEIEHESMRSLPVPKFIQQDGGAKTTIVHKRLEE